MKKNRIIYHVVALICAGLGLYIVYRVSCYLFLPLGKDITIVSYAKMLWATQDWFYRGLLVVNFLIKPLLIYYLIWLFFTLLEERKK